MKLVKFIGSAPPYTHDDTAAFKDEIADKYIAMGVAIPFELKSPEPTPAPEPVKVADLEEKKIIDPAPAKPAGPHKKTVVTKGA